MTYHKKANLAVILAASTLALAACTAAPADKGDPLEPTNRAIFKFNETLDKMVIRPIAYGYRYLTPGGIRSRIGNASDNLREPLNMINAFLQGDFTQGMVSFWRFTINTTIGIGGLNDVAGSAGLKYRREDFGQTLGVWGSTSGPYVMLPILGPSNVRDTSGRVVDWFMDPFSWVLTTRESIYEDVGQGLVERERLLDPIDDIYENSLDPYVSFRSIYTQHRDAAIRNNKGGKDSGYGFEYNKSE